MSDCLHPFCRSEFFPFRVDPFSKKIWCMIKETRSHVSPLYEMAEKIQKSKKEVHRVPQSQTAALPRHQEEEETDKTKQAQIEQMYKKH